MTEHRRAVDSTTPTKAASPIDRLGHVLKVEGDMPVIPDVRTSDLEPYVGLRYLSKLFKLMGVVLGLLLIAEVVTGVVAQGSAGRDGMWRARMSDSLIERVYSWAQKKNALLFIDVQVGHSTLQAELPRLARFLERPDVHLGIDPEFSMKGGQKPGTKIGTFDAADVNYATKFLSELVASKNLPPKVLVVHRFTRPMITNTSNIRLDPRVQIVINMDGWGPQWMKLDSYHDYVYLHPVQYTGFKLFYHNDTKKGNALLTPEQVLKLFPKPVYIQYQ